MRWAAGRRRRADTDRLLLDRAARRLGLQAAALVSGVVVVLAVVLGLLIVRAQRSDDQALIHHAAAVADDATDPPAGMWLVLQENGRSEVTPGLPAGLPVGADLAAVRAGHRPIERRTTAGGVHVEVLTQRRPGGAVQAVLDLRTQDRLETHVVEALVGVGLVGLLAAAGVGSFLARRAVRPLASALALQRAFVADASHELRTPLTLLSTRAQLLHRDLVAGGAAPATVRDARGVVEDTGRLADVVEDLLLAADPRQDDAPTEADLGDLCADVVASAGAYARGREVDLRLVREPAPVLGNATALRRAVLALVDNAVRHTPPGGSVTVTVGASRGRASAVVADTGPGLDPGDAERIFRRFASGGQQASRRSYGLGLALVRDVAARHGGDVRLLPSEVGASFALELPAR